MMNNVNLPLALFTVFVRRFIDKLRAPHNTLIARHAPWYRHLIYLKPCMYMYMVCAGAYYTYKHLHHRPRIVQFSKKFTRLQGIKDNSLSRRKFIDQNKMWFLRNLAGGRRGRDSVLQVLSSQLPNAPPTPNPVVQRQNLCQHSQASASSAIPTSFFLAPEKVPMINLDSSASLCSEANQEIKSDIETQTELQSSICEGPQRDSNDDLFADVHEIEINNSIGRNIMERKAELLQERAHQRNLKELEEVGSADINVDSIIEKTMDYVRLLKHKQRRKRKRSNNRILIHARMQKSKFTRVKPSKQVHNFIKKTRSGRIYGYSEQGMQLSGQ